MSGDVAIRRYIQGDEEQIVPMLDQVFKGWPRIDITCSKQDFWSWKYGGVEKRFITVATDDDKLVGCHHVVQFTAKVEDRLFPCTTTSDVAVHGDYREMGVMKRMSREFSRPWRAGEGTVFDYCIIGNPALVKSYSKSTPRFPAEIINMTWIGDIDRQLAQMGGGNAAVKKYGYLSLRAANSLRNTLKPKPREVYELEEVSEFPGGVDAIVEQVTAEHSFILVRSPAEMRKRYSDSRRPATRMYVARRGDQPVGFTVLRVNRHNPNYPLGYIMELMAIPGEEECLTMLVGRCVDYCKEADVNILNYMTPRGHRYVEAFSRNGFLDSRIGLNIFIVASEPGWSLPEFKQEQVYLTWGDFDVLPAGTPRYEN